MSFKFLKNKPGGRVNYCEYAIPENMLWLIIIAIGVIIKKSKWYKALKIKLGDTNSVKRIKNNPLETWIRAYAHDVKLREMTGQLTIVERFFARIIKLRKYTGGTIANLISTLRILLAVIVLLILVIYQLTMDKVNLLIGQATYIIASLLDLLDGATARALKEISKLGKILDPIADKILVASTIFMLSGYLHNFIFWSVVRQEIILSIITGLKFATEKLPFTMATQANRWGKVKTVFEFTGCIALFLCPFYNVFSVIANISFAISIPLAIGSIVNYIASVEKNVKISTI